MSNGIAPWAALAARTTASCSKLNANMLNLRGRVLIVHCDCTTAALLPSQAVLDSSSALGVPCVLIIFHGPFAKAGTSPT